jgi:hypothetical protein
LITARCGCGARPAAVAVVDVLLLPLLLLGAADDVAGRGVASQMVEYSAE